MVSVSTGSYSDISISGARDSFGEDEDAGALDLIPIVEGRTTYGVSEGLNVGMRVNTASFVSGHVKHQVLGTRSSPVAVSVGLEAGANVGAFSQGFAYAYGLLPITLSYHPTETVALYLVPRYTLATIVPFAPPPGSERTSSSTWDFPSLSYGVAFGQRNRLMVEVAHYRQGSAAVSQVSLGYALRLD